MRLNILGAKAKETEDSIKDKFVDGLGIRRQRRGNHSKVRRFDNGHENNHGQPHDNRKHRNKIGDGHPVHFNELYANEQPYRQ